MSQSEKNFKYFVARKDFFLVVSFVGNLADSVADQLEKCKNEILEHPDLRALVLHFGEVSEIGMDAVPILAQIQAAARTRNLQLRLSGLSGELLEKLYKKGVIRKQELANDLREALLHVARLAAQAMTEEKKAA
ncbi:MAG: STAS domain-containing protein [Bdellovibrionales bacterium]|nr:STAS domain-containing protein [Bdellovibrionales bacterium]